MRSSIVKILAIVVIGLAILLDVVLHGHFDDGKLRDLVREKLATAPNVQMILDPDVKVKDRTAYISGAVDTEAERQAATRAALDAPGILTLVNDIRVDTLLEDLFRRLKELTEADPTAGEFSYRVHPDHHTVTLDGWVPEGEEDLREALGKMAEKVPGVRRVINNIGVGRPGGDIEQMILDILRMKNIYFDYNKTTIRPESMESIKKIAGVLQSYPNVRIRVEGHTDAIASEQYNQRLSEGRAESVKAALVEHGVDTGRLDTVGRGETSPIAPNNTPEGRSDNRRIEFKVTGGTFEEPAATTAGEQVR